MRGLRLWAVVISMVGLVALVFIGGYLLGRGSREGSVGKENLTTGTAKAGYRNVSLKYDDQDRCFVLLAYPEKAKAVDLAVYVHGGGFVHGEASLGGVAGVFRDNGFATASVEYRLCPDVNFTTLLGDVARGIKRAIEYLEEEGIRVNLTLVAGSSAGAIAEAILLYAPPSEGLDLSALVDGFIGMSGGYCASYAGRNPREKASSCGVPIEEMMPFDDSALSPPSAKVPALLINGISDATLDGYAGRDGYNHHARCMEGWLREHDVHFEVLQVEGGHGTPKEMFLKGDPRVVEAVDRLLHYIGWSGEFKIEEGRTSNPPVSNLTPTVHWALDSIQDGIVSESVAALNGKTVGVISVGGGKVGNALYFTGAGYVDLAAAIGRVAGLEEGSISLWFKYDQSEQNVLPILYFGSGSEAEDSLFIIEIGHARATNRKLYVTSVTGRSRPALCFDSGFNLEAGRWYHLVVVVSPEGNTAYLDGRELSNRHYNFGDPSISLFFRDIPSKDIFALGYGKTAHQITPHFLYFRGAIDDVRIFGSALNTSQVRDLT